MLVSAVLKIALVAGLIQCAHAGFVLEIILLQPRLGAGATANLYLQAQGDAPYPAVMLVVGHDDRGKADPVYPYAAQLLAHQGIAALVPDPLGQGERFEHYEAEMGFQPIQGCSGEHDLLDWKAKLLGWSLARYFVHDGICALDYLASRPDIDDSCIGLTGHSGGGTQTCMLMLAAGDRLACSAPCAYVTDAQAMVEAETMRCSGPAAWLRGWTMWLFWLGLRPVLCCC